ncbi:unnamed protein product [Lactuca virosa]|uniref:Uncharacterized protein n=1 Tax=Lactuca virosa TaxID=75947 RepID=A0AAU9M859_9ASTR|nr:unnamed protein product [Lactuca virosa]
MKERLPIPHCYKDENLAIMEWIEEEKFGKRDNANDTCEDDVDSVRSDDVSVDHEDDDAFTEIPKSVDPYLSHKKFILGGVEDEADDEVVQFLIHDPN